LLQQHAFDLLITDDQMPQMTGSELCLRIRQAPHLAQLPVIMLTGKTPESDRLPHRLDAGEVIPKPFSPRKLVGIVMDRLLASSPSVP
jgi:CheY-like chemotaxis protein